MYWLSKKQAVEIVILVIGVYIMVSLGKSLWQLSEAKERLVEAKNRVENLKKENEKLQKDLEKVQSDEYVEKIARDKLNLQLPGETVVVIPELRQEGEGSQAAEEEQTDDSLEYEVNWKKWLKVFGLQ